MFTLTESSPDRNFSLRPVCKATDRPVIRELFRKEFYGEVWQPYPDEGLWEIYDSMEPNDEDPFGVYLVSWREHFLFLLEVHPLIQMDLPTRLLSQPDAVGIYCFYSSIQESMNLPAFRVCIDSLLRYPAVKRILTTQTHPNTRDPRTSLLERSGFQRLPKNPDRFAVFCCTRETFSKMDTNTPFPHVNQSYTLEKFIMKHADKPFIGILIVTMAILYGVIALLS